MNCPEQSRTKGEFQKSVMTNFIRNLTSLDQTLTIFKPEFKAEFGLRPELLNSLLPMTQSPVPALQTSWSQANQVANRSPNSKRQKLFTSLYKELSNCLGGDSYVQFVHILPHFQVHWGRVTGSVRITSWQHWLLDLWTKATWFRFNILKVRIARKIRSK